MKKSEFNLLVKLLTQGLKENYSNVKFWEVNPDELRIEDDTTFKWEVDCQYPKDIEINYHQTDTDKWVNKLEKVTVGSKHSFKTVKNYAKLPVADRSASIYVTEKIGGATVTKYLYVDVIDKLSQVSGKEERYFVFSIDICLDNVKIANHRDGMFLEKEHTNDWLFYEKETNSRNLRKMVLGK